ncbi:hypothetical protein COLU111180_11955 [Cohnella lubricantis]|uniref:Uncharacterized protein n=1 Tax=Cohnella lubricantis TaxID=2163172 RepID=A0A841T7N8_9BACL|nr:hypothetical protein [Cohnella lubricantis]MBB6675985.1 hypothetical protein [Cohnella lubricantis]MBP2117896.1 hypothetical protein [Cohnella lubricantis]
MFKVIEVFQDKHTGQPYRVGDIFEGDSKRTAELVKAGYLEKVAEEPVVVPDDPADKE